MKRQKLIPYFTLLISLGLIGCTPRIQLDTPKEGITINMNVVVDHKISVEMDDKIKQVVDEK
ncbi:MAG TPA: YnbE family lipoprotein [Pasteurellaceae bacterium]|nr:YnbE family lipoprotein [Pasteurellaceae bacterium]